MQLYIIIIKNILSSEILISIRINPLFHFIV